MDADPPDYTRIGYELATGLEQVLSVQSLLSLQAFSSPTFVSDPTDLCREVQNLTTGVEK